MGYYDPAFIGTNQRLIAGLIDHHFTVADVRNGFVHLSHGANTGMEYWWHLYGVEPRPVHPIAGVSAENFEYSDDSDLDELVEDIINHN
jgi:hypothetical protein